MDHKGTNKRRKHARKKEEKKKKNKNREKVGVLLVWVGGGR